jgi:hypothetical protein
MKPLLLLQKPHILPTKGMGVFDSRVGTESLRCHTNTLFCNEFLDRSRTDILGYDTR